jgi:hypothetical protein
MKCVTETIAMFGFWPFVDGNVHRVMNLLCCNCNKYN